MTQGYDPNDPAGQGGYQPPQYGSQPPQYGSQPPVYGGPGGYPVSPPTDQNAVIALVISIVSLVVCWPAGIVSLIMGMTSLRKINESGGQVGGRGLAIGAIAVSIVDILITIAIITVFVIILAAGNGTSSSY